MNILFIEYPKCSTCKKAKSWLIENKIEIMDRNIVEEVPTYNELKKWIELSGKPINKFFNTSGILYRQMEISKKLLNMTKHFRNFHLNSRQKCILSRTR